MELSAIPEGRTVIGRQISASIQECRYRVAAKSISTDFSSESLLNNKEMTANFFEAVENALAKAFISRSPAVTSSPKLIPSEWYFITRTIYPDTNPHHCE